MTDTQKTFEAASWDDAQSSQFIKFATNERKTYAVKDWSLAWVEEADYEDKTKMVRKVRFNCDVVGIDGKQSKAKIGTTSKRFIDAVRPHLKNAQGIVFLRIKKLGEGNAVNYDVELAEPTVLA